MAQSQKPLPPLDAMPGPASAASPSELRALRNTILERGRVPREARGAWSRPLPLAAAVGLSLLLAGTGFAAVRAWPALRASFAPPPAPKPRPVQTARSSPPPEAAAAISQLPVVPIAPSEPQARPAPPSRREATAKAAIDRLARANELRAQRRWSAAEALYLEVLESRAGVQASSTAALAAAELRLYHRGKPRPALALFRRALAIEPTSAIAEQARHGIALCYRALDDHLREREALEAFLRAHPGSPMRARAESRLAELRQNP